jgi:hypothetical protein
MNVKREDATALIVVLFFLTVIIAMIGVMYEAIFYSQKALHIQRNRAAAIEIAESALTVALWRLEKDADYSGETLDILGGTAETRISGEGTSFLVEIKAAYRPESSLEQEMVLSAEIFKLKKRYAYRHKRIRPPAPTLVGFDEEPHK